MIYTRYSILVETYICIKLVYTVNMYVCHMSVHATQVYEYAYYIRVQKYTVDMYI